MAILVLSRRRDSLKVEHLLHDQPQSSSAEHCAKNWPRRSRRGVAHPVQWEGDVGDAAILAAHHWVKHVKLMDLDGPRWTSMDLDGPMEPCHIKIIKPIYVEAMASASLLRLDAAGRSCIPRVAWAWAGPALNWATGFVWATGTLKGEDMWSARTNKAATERCSWCSCCSCRQIWPETQTNIWPFSRDLLSYKIAFWICFVGLLHKARRKA